MRVLPDNENRLIIADILDFWFGDIGAGFAVQAQAKRWYGGGAELDSEISERFGRWLITASEGKLSSWNASAEGTLALIILLDQFSRNIHRGSARAFAADGIARQTLQAALSRGVEAELTIVERSFLYMPLEHSEALEDQNHCVALFEQLLSDAPAAGKAHGQNCLDYAIHHRDIIQRFGRFPHRNQVLGRVPTPEEQAYLDDGGARFGQ